MLRMWRMWRTNRLEKKPATNWIVADVADVADNYLERPTWSSVADLLRSLVAIPFLSYNVYNAEPIYAHAPSLSATSATSATCQPAAGDSGREPIRNSPPHPPHRAIA